MSTVAHPWASTERRVGDFRDTENKHEFTSRRVFTVTAGQELWIGNNEAGWTCTDDERNPNRFTHCIETRHDSSQTYCRERYGAGQGRYTGSVKYYWFNVNQLTKLRKPRHIEYAWQFVRWVGAALLEPDAKVLVPCALPAWVS